MAGHQGFSGKRKIKYSFPVVSRKNYKPLGNFWKIPLRECL